VSAPDETEHATLADGTVLRELTLRQLADLRWDAEQGVAVWTSATDQEPSGG
jgi:hypothetical protein